MSKFTNLPYHPKSEELVQVLMEVTQNKDPLFFRVISAYYMCLIAAKMHCSIEIHKNDQIPVNMYAFGFAPSGAGKTRAMSFIKTKVLNHFNTIFKEVTFHAHAEKAIVDRAGVKSNLTGEEYETVLTDLQVMFKKLGPLPDSYNCGSGPALADIRYKVQMAGAGCLNLVVDEFAVKVDKAKELLIEYLDLFDVGQIEQKITKNTNENQRKEDRHEPSPACAMIFSEPSKMMQPGEVADVFWSLEKTGWGRRAFHALTLEHEELDKELTPEDIYNQRNSPTVHGMLASFSEYLGRLADINNMHKVLAYPKETAIYFIEYERDCKDRASKLAFHDDLKKTEMEHRHFKALKLAGAYAFVDGTPEITIEQAKYAIALAEESGESYALMCKRDAPHVALAKYLAKVGRAVTQSDMALDNHFYKGAKSHKEDMLTMAIAHGYQNSIIITKEEKDGIEFYTGETLEETDLDNITISWSKDMAQGYGTQTPRFDQLHQMTQAPGIHWCNHSMRDGHRCSDATIEGFNLVVLDVDHGVPIQTAKELLKGYKALFYTTRSHTANDHCYRIILPTNFILKLSEDDHRLFMKNIYDWIPFKLDECTFNRSRKWLSNKGEYFYTEGELLDVIPFIPKTTKGEQFMKQVVDQAGMDNMERWFINKTEDGNRNNMLHRFAMILVDANVSGEVIEQKILALNSKISMPLKEAELKSTVISSIKQKIVSRK